jgi:S-adenosylmethionine hydrolase
VPAEIRQFWKPCGVVTLTSDFGFDDPYVGIMKGVLLSQQPDLALVDLTHSVPPQDVRAAAFFLERSWSWFPAGSVHVAVVDPGVGSERAILAAFDQGHAFLAPDNGLLSGLLSASADVRVLSLERFSLSRRSRTFHGRDVFAPAAARIAAGLSAEEVGPAATTWLRIERPRAAREGPDRVRGEVLFADRFGNLVTNVEAGELEAPPRAWRAFAGGREIPVGSTYSDVPPGGLLALVDSFDCWELAERGGSAARSLGLGPGSEVLFRRGSA